MCHLLVLHPFWTDIQIFHSQNIHMDEWTGYTSYRENLQRFIDYMVAQKLIEKSMPVATLFHESVQLT